EDEVVKRCHACKSESLVVSTDARLYPESGLPNVTVEGIRRVRCSACGESWEDIPRLAELHQVIADAVIHKRSRLSGAEVKYLRKYIGWSSSDFAKRIGADPATVSKW